MSQVPYPSTPGVDIDKLTRTGPDYQAQVFKVLLSILLFIAVYVLMLAASVLFCIVCGICLVSVLQFLQGFLALFLVLGVALMCGMLCYFLVKFLFQVRTNDMKGKVQVFATEHPQLFAFIDKLCEETGAPKPKKVIISPNVNAAVYYNSSFLSLFLPVNK